MKKSRYSEEQVIGALKQMESGRKARELARELGVRDVALVRAEHSLSERRACKLLGVERTSYRYEPRPEREAASIIPGRVFGGQVRD